MYLGVYIKARMSYICGYTFFQFASVTEGDSNTHIVKEESSSGFRTSAV